MELFEKVEQEKYSWTLFYLLNDICYNEDDCKIVREDLGRGGYIEREVTTGVGLNIAEENRKFDACKGLLVFTREVELILLCPDRETNLYTSSKKESTEKGKVVFSNVDINSIDIVGRYIYVSPKEVCSPVYMRNGTPYEDTYFCNFKEYILTGHTEVEPFIFDFKAEKATVDNEFIIQYVNEEGYIRELLKIKGVTKDISYPFVFYVLKNMRKNKHGFETHLRIEKIRKKEF